MDLNLFGLQDSNHDFRQSEPLGKNIFTNAFPVSLAQYLDLKKELPIPLIKAKLSNASLTTGHEPTPWSSIIGCDPSTARFEFETVFDQFNSYTHTSANKSDVIAVDSETGTHRRPLELKLVVVPTSSTALKPLEQQSCEIVVRPPTVEQLAFSIAHSFGQDRRPFLQETIAAALMHPNDFQWRNKRAMIEAMPHILDAAEAIIQAGLEIQTPLVLTAVWRSEGQKPVLAENAFDVFVWTDLAFIQLFTDAVAKSFGDPANQALKKITAISRPARSLVWLIKSLWDYTTQGTLNFKGIESEITYEVQSDKAGSFSGGAALRHLQSPEFLHPRVMRKELDEILNPGAVGLLLPERRLDAAITIQQLANEQRGLPE